MMTDRTVKYYIYFFLVFFIFFSVSGVCAADNTISPRNRGADEGGEDKKADKQYVRIRGGLKKMMELSDSQKEMQEALDEETRKYSHILKEVEQGHLKKGMYTSEITDRYGDPVVINKKLYGDKEWIYKAGKDSYFLDKEVKLLFNTGGSLVSWSAPSEPGSKK